MWDRKVTPPGRFKINVPASRLTHDVMEQSQFCSNPHGGLPFRSWSTEWNGWQKDAGLTEVDLYSCTWDGTHHEPGWDPYWWDCPAKGRLCRRRSWCICFAWWTGCVGTLLMLLWPPFVLQQTRIEKTHAWLFSAHNWAFRAFQRQNSKNSTTTLMFF